MTGVITHYLHRRMGEVIKRACVARYEGKHVEEKGLKGCMYPRGRSLRCCTSACEHAMQVYIHVRGQTQAYVRTYNYEEKEADMHGVQ